MLAQLCVRAAATCVWQRAAASRGRRRGRRLHAVDSYTGGGCMRLVATCKRLRAMGIGDGGDEGWG